jgi:hypothetical protein
MFDMLQLVVVIMGHYGTGRVLRGGSWNNNGRNCRSANRNYHEPDERNSNIGFRFSRAQQEAGWPLLTRPLSSPAACKSAGGENQKGGNVQVAKKRKLIDRPTFS